MSSIRRSKQRISLFDRYPIVRITVCFCIILATASLFTPFPAELIKALRQEHIEQPPLAKIKPQQADTKETLPPAPQAQPAPKIPANMIEADLVSPWAIERSSSSPSVQYPPFPPVMPTKPNDNAVWNVQELSRGLNLKTQVNFKKGTLASLDKKDKSNYRATLTYEIALPEALTKESDFCRINPELPSILPGLGDLISTAKVSPFYTQLYSRKQNEIRKKMVQLNRVLDRHNFYDTETILETNHPKTGRKVLLIQSEMDVVSDGSDGDRLPTMPDKVTKSSFYQPSTSYRWKKKTETPNPLLAVWEKKLKGLKADLAKAPASSRSTINNNIDYAQRVILELKQCSFLIAEYDPFIVIPLGIVNQKSSYSPSFGDYAVVIVGNKIYPAIVGDAGPRYKMGEASLRLAQTVNPKADSYSRPVSDLTVSYLVFPGTAPSNPSPPDYKVWHETCSKLLQEIGGLGNNYTLHEWVDLLAPPSLPPVELPTNGGEDASMKTQKPSPSGDAQQTGKPSSSPSELNPLQSTPKSPSPATPAGR